jgi:hypothetical protein
VGAAIGAAVQRGFLRVWATVLATAERADEAALAASRKVLLGDLGLIGAHNIDAGRPKGDGGADEAALAATQRRFC